MYTRNIKTQQYCVYKCIVQIKEYLSKTVKEQKLLDFRLLMGLSCVVTLRVAHVHAHDASSSRGMA